MDSNLYNKIQEDLKLSLKNRQNEDDALRLSVLRLIVSEIKNKKIDKQEDLNESEIVAILKKAVKSREDSIEQYTKAGRPELAAKEAQEITIIKAYLPEEYSEEEVGVLVDQVVEKMRLNGEDVTSPRSFGNIMKEVMALASQNTSKTINGSVVSSVVKAKLK